MTGKHKAPRRRLSRRLSPLVVVLMLIGSSVAVAVYVYTLFVQGSVSIADGSVIYSTGAVGTDNPNCVAGHPDDTHLTLNWQAFPDDNCVVTVAFTSGPTQSANMKLQGLSVPAELTATLGGDCGKEILAGNGATPAATVSLMVDPGIAPGTVLTLDPDTWGFEWVPSASYNPALCT